MKEYIKTEEDVLRYIKSESIVIQSEMYRKKRQFQKIDIDLFESIINNLKKERKISIKILSGRKFCIIK